MVDKEALDIMENLMEAFGPSGFEREVNSILKEYMKAYSDEAISDKLGSVTFIKRGKTEKPRVLFAGHTDEVGFVVSSITKEGFLTFNPLGGWWDQVLLGQRVVIRGNKGDIPGIIAAKPPHILPDEERKKIVEKTNMYIDVGCVKNEEVKEIGVKVGDPIVPWSPFSIIRDGKIAMGKAFDDRIGAFVFSQVFRRIKENDIEHPNTLYGAATVQEEVGLRGAITTAHMVDPDVSIVLEVDVAGDIPGITAKDALTKMGKGPGLLTFDGSMIPNQPFKEFVIEVAKQCQIPLQLSQMRRGGTDGGRIHINRSGCPTVVLTVPTRHIHSPVGLLSLKDTENAVRLVVELVKRLDHETVKSFTAL